MSPWFPSLLDILSVSVISEFLLLNWLEVSACPWLPPLLNILPFNVVSGLLLLSGLEGLLAAFFFCPLQIDPFFGFSAMSLCMPIAACLKNADLCLSSIAPRNFLNQKPGRWRCLMMSLCRDSSHSVSPCISLETTCTLFSDRNPR
ncbi:hypothetical protein GDO86_015827 [Hymenochirus boettgeri]|uniref:Uncharacterized protein n=1 Tax=Hymenochirus boettgeri TaxID=247094 RepID=A0A8T2K0F4_9PIPI|nr:hypothetical protein GDO86_015827 [Hymenochirus boettgeri]